MAWIVVCVALWVGMAEAAESERAMAEPSKTVPTPGPAPLPLTLDQLLRPRTPLADPVVRHGGKDRRHWQQQFERARAEISTLAKQIETTQTKIREASAGGWSYSPAGGPAPVPPEVLQLRAQLRRDRTSLKTARKRLRDLDVEASLAGVPQDWKVAPAESDP